MLAKVKIFKKILSGLGDTFRRMKALRQCLCLLGRALALLGNFQRLVYERIRPAVYPMRRIRSSRTYHSRMTVLLFSHIF